MEDGRIKRPVNINPAKRSDGVLPRINSTHNEIYSNYILRLLFQAAPDGFFVMMLPEPVEWDVIGEDPELFEQIYTSQKITIYNPRAIELNPGFGGNLMGVTPQIYFNYDDENGRAAWLKLLNTGWLSMEYSEEIEPGKAIWIEASFANLYENDGRLLGCFCTQRDITLQHTETEAMSKTSGDLGLSIASIGDPLIMADSAGVITYLNYAAEITLDLSYDRVVNKRITDVIQIADPEAQLVLKQILDQVRTTGLPFRLSEGAKIKYGVKENEITGVISSVARDDGQHVGWILLLRYPAPVRKELIEDTGNMERLKRLSKSIQAGYWENDLIQGKVWISDEIFGLYKIKRTSLGDPNEFNLLQKKINELIVSEDLPKVERAANDLIANYKGYSVDYRIKDTETGSTRYLKSIVEVHSNTSGHPVLISGVAIDLTWYYNYLTTGSFYGKIIENAPVGILVTDPAGIIQYTNKKITEMTGYEPQELAGLKPSVFKSGVLPPQFYENLWNTVLSGQIWQGDIINKRKDGSHYWDSEAITGIKGETGEIERLVAFKRDITQRKKYEGDLKKQRELFERLHKEKVGLLQDLNLEVRDPLNGVMGYLDLLADEITDTDHRKLIRSVKQSTERVINRLNSVADILNMESDSWFVRLKRTSIAAALEETLHYYQLIAEEKGLRFESYIQEGTSLVTDSELIAKATGNLLDNAIKFTREGSVRIEVLKPSTDENEINIRVTDTGPGIKKEEIEAIFSETSEMPRSDNSGFGLRLTREILKKLGGTIRIESVPGKRTSFTIVLSEGGPDLQTDQELEKLRHFRKMTQSSLQHEILLVEDSKVNAEVIALYLRKVCRVEIARSGEQGLQKAQTKRYSAVIMDINLGEGLSGIETMKEMKMIEGYKDIPFVAVTGYALNSDREKIMSEGFDFFFTKPLDMAEFAVFVKELVLPGSGG